MSSVTPWPDLARSRLISGQHSRDRVAAWYNAVSPIDRYNGSAALLAIGDGSWVEKYPWAQDFEQSNRFHITVSREIVITIRLNREYPGYFSVDRIGRA